MGGIERKEYRMPKCPYYGDNLDVLKRYVKDETIGLIYLDPHFNSNATDNDLVGQMFDH